MSELIERSGVISHTNNIGPVEIIPKTVSPDVWANLPEHVRVVRRDPAGPMQKFQKAARLLAICLAITGGSFAIEEVTYEDIPDPIQLAAIVLTAGAGYATRNKWAELSDVIANPIAQDPRGKPVLVGNPNAPHRIVAKRRIQDQPVDTGVIQNQEEQLSLALLAEESAPTA